MVLNYCIRVFEKFLTRDHVNSNETLNYIGKKNLFQVISTMRILLTMSVSVANAERVFAKVKIKQSKIITVTS